MPKLRFKIFHFSIPSFHLFGAIGFVVGTSLGIFLALHQHLPLWVLGLMSLLGAFQLFAHTWIQKVITGEEDLVYYRHEIGILLLCAIVLWSIGQPVAPFLDVSLLGVGVFLVFGRWGCYHVGCCHGRPCKIGIKYTEEHAHVGFPFYLVGLKIFPIPLIESFFVFITVLVGTLLILQNYPPGTVLIWYTVFYGSIRFILEFFRGDPERPYWKGFSEAQWTTLALIVFTALLGFSGQLPFYAWHTGVAGSLILAMFTISFYRQQQSVFYRINAPHHVQEIAFGLLGAEQMKFNLVSPGGKTAIPVAHTSLGLKISAGETPTENGHITHYTISNTIDDKTPHKSMTVNQQSAKAIGQLIALLRHGGSPFHLRQGQTAGIYHIIFNQFLPMIFVGAFIVL